MNNLIDLHTHSYYSDGDESPDELITLAKEKGVTTIAITDHDTLLGNKNISLNHINIIPGIELSAKVKKGRMHILGYNYDLNNEALNKKMAELKNNSIESVIAIIDQIKKDYNIVFPQEEIDNLINSVGNISRPDIAKLCMKYGYVQNSQEAFDKYLIAAYEKTRKVTKGIQPEECIDLITKANGIPVLAHPISLELTNKELLLTIRELLTCGLQGLEVYHPNHSPENTNLYYEIANKLDLLISGGTDYHGAIVKPNIKMGTGENNNIHIKQLSIVDYISKQKQVIK